RLLIVTGGAALASLIASLSGVATTARLLAEVPWDVLVILVGLGILSEVFVASRLFGVLAARITRVSRADPRRLAVLFALGMYLVSGLVNNLTALVLVLPVLLILFKLVGVTQRYVSWTLGLVLIACNLGGAATPIGDFPAILLLGRGSMGFPAYLERAAPATAVALVVLLCVIALLRTERGTRRDPLSARLSLSVMDRLYRNVRLDWGALVPATVALTAMLAAWLFVPARFNVGPELICWIGAGTALVAQPRLGEKLLRRRVDVEAALFLLALFVMVGAVRRSGVFEEVARALAALPLSPEGQLLVFLGAAGILTGIFSAGPGMAALLDVADALARQLPPEAVYVGLALSVCAGSSLFLTAATSGPMAQALTERAA
ncbi:MAG: SLC13 family permease, partial [Myxococcales bacterium]